MKELLLNLLTGAFEKIGESKLEEVLQHLHDTNPAQYKNAVIGGWALTNSLMPLVQKTGTKIDDAVVGAVQDAIRNSALRNDVELPS